MASIENRIVQMQFDNTSFEKRMADTLKSLGQLNTTLANAGSKNGLADLENSVKGFNLSGMTTSIEGVSAKFLALATIGVTALATIVTHAIGAGAKVLSSFSLQPIISGFQEYGTQIGAIQTILSNTASKGTSLDQVNNALNQLNTYSDKTIFNFTEMARNIGTFTAAGVDLDTSVQSIKGIANLAAISGSNSEQASTAMYQLSQAIAAGSVKLMDWNSVVNAGMGGEVFQKALFNTGKQMGTIADVPMSQSFEEWTAKGNTFRGSLEKGWLSADVLTATLAQFTGELTKDQIMAQGFTDSQADEILKLGALGVDAATKVRTLKGLIDTTKEALGSGWSSSFRIIFGDFNQATELFTGVSNALNGVIQKSADSRNALLQGWSDLGGRTLLIETLKTAFQNLGEILAPIRQAFSEIFPPLTAQRLMDITQTLKNLADSLKPSAATVDDLKRIFKGFFGALEIGWTVLKETAKFIGELFGSLTGAGSGAFLEFAAKIGDFFSGLNDKLVTQGGIAKFFADLPDKIKPVTDKIADLKAGFQDFLDKIQVKFAPIIHFVEDMYAKFESFFGLVKDNGLDVVSDATNRLGQRFDTLRDIVSKISDMWGPFKDGLMKVADVLDQVWEVIKNWFKELGTKLKAVIGPGDFDAVVDAVNVGLLGAIAGILAKFLKGGLKLDLGHGFFDSITGAFDQLTGVLTAMQTNLKAEALEKIAIAIGILTASVLVLSLIDSAALTTALAAMAVGFGQLVGAFALMNKVVSGPKDAAKLSILAVGLGILSGAMLILSAAVKVFSTMSWEDLGKGLASIAVLLLGLTLVAGPLGDSSSGMIRAGLGITALAIGLNILAGAVKIFSTFSWTDMLKGAVGIGGGLLIIAAAMQLMPATLPITAVGLLIVAAALSALAGAVALFGTLDWSTMGKGAAGIGGGLLIIAGAMQLMPPTLPITALGLLLVAASLGKIADALGKFGGMDWGQIGKGLAAMGGSLLILAAGAYAMSGSLLGAVAIGVMAVSLTLLVRVIKEMAAIKVGDLVKAMIGLAAVFAVLGGAALLLAPIAPALLALGAALILVGAGFALFGVGAALVATAFEKLAQIGPTGLAAVGAAIDLLITKLPALIAAFADGLIQLAQVILDAAPVLIDSLGVVLEHVISTIITLLPKVGELISGIIQTVIDVLREKIPEYIQLGIDIILALLTGIRDNIGQVVGLAVQIIANFVQGIADNIPQLVDSAVNLITSFVDAIAANLDQIIASGVNLLVSFLDGITSHLGDITAAVGRLVAAFIADVVALYTDIINAGVDALIQFLKGITDNLIKVTTAVASMIERFIKAVGDSASGIAKAGTDALVAFLGGMTNNVYRVALAAAQLVIQFVQSIANSATQIAYAGINAVVSFANGIASAVVYMVNAGFVIIIGFINGLADAINRYAPQLRQAGLNLAFAIIDGATWGLASKARDLANKAKDVFSNAIGAVEGVLHIGGPSKVFMDIGQGMMDGTAIGIARSNSAEKAIVSSVEGMTHTVRDALNKFTADIQDMGSLNPTITPILDLSQVQKDAQLIGGLMPGAVLTPGLSSLQAQTIATSSQQTDQTSTDEGPTPTEIKFEQNIYAPEQLSTGDIYRQTRTQLTMAKEELSIP